MKVAVVMPVFRRVKTACNATACFLAQILPADCRATLFVFDDGDTFADLGFASSPDRSVVLWKASRRFPSLGAKYTSALEAVLRDDRPDIVAIFEDDDVYLPWHLGVHVECLRGKSGAWSKPSKILTDYHGDLREENAAGRFHGSIAFTADVAARWPEDGGADFDQRFMAALRDECGPPRDPLEVYPKPSYIFRWHTGDYHAQWWMNGQGSGWYDQVEKYVPDPPRALLVPEMDNFTLEVYESLGRDDRKEH